MTQAKADAIATTRVRIAEERGAIAKTTPGTPDHAFAVSELQHYEALLARLLTTYRLRSGELVTSTDGDWPTQYANRTQAQRAADKIPGAAMIQRGRPFYVRLPEDAG